MTVGKGSDRKLPNRMKPAHSPTEPNISGIVLETDNECISLGERIYTDSNETFHPPPKHDRAGSVRYVLGALLFMNCVLLHAMRLNLSVSITAMVNTTKLDSAPPSDDTCRDPHQQVEETRESVHPKTGEFDWDESEQARVTSAFFVGYILTQVPGGYLAEKYSVTWVFGLAMGATSILSCWTAVAARAHINALLAIRFLEGLSEGVMYPCAYVFISKWVPLQEQGLLMNLIFTGGQVGTIVTMIGSAILCDSSWGWPSSFSVFGIIGIIFSILWVLLSADDPESHRWISHGERAYISENRLCTELSRKPATIPWKNILLSPAVLLLGYETFCSGLIYYIILTELPSYLKYMFGITIIDNGVISGAAAFAAVISMVLWGWASDEILARKLVSRNSLRKFAAAVCCLVPCICLIIVPQVGCSYEVIVALMIFNCICQGASGASESLLPLEIAPNFPGIVQGFVNGMSNVSGIVAPLLVGVLTNHENTLHQWNLVFYSIAAIAVTGIILFLRFGSTERQAWDEVREDEDEDRVALLSQA